MWADFRLSDEYGSFLTASANLSFRASEMPLYYAAVKPFFLLLSLIVSTLAGAREPAEVALDFLVKVRSGKANLEPGGDTALSANTEAAKTREIARRLERTASDLATGTLELGSTKIDDTLAAVLIRKIGGFDPSRLRVFAVALVKKGDAWLPAPVLASYENTGLGFEPGLRQRARSLEDWMLEQQSQELDTLRQQATDRMRAGIAARLSVDALRQLAPEAIGRRFVESCAKADLPGILGLLGGLQTALPEDWSNRLQATEAAIASPHLTPRPWRLLVAPDILRTVVHQEFKAATGSLSIACLDPTRSPGNAAQPKVEFVHLKLSKSSEDLWQVDLPQEFLDPEPADDEKEDEKAYDLLDEYPNCLRDDHPLQPQASTESAAAALLKALQAPTPAPLIALLDLKGPSKTARLGVTRAISAWGALHDPSVVRSPLQLGMFSNESVAAVSFQFFSVRQDALDLRVFYFERQKDGWCLPTGLSVDPATRPAFLPATVWADGQAKSWANTWREKLLAGSTRLAAISPTDAPTEADARKLISRWLETIRTGNIHESLALTAWLDPEKSPSRLLRNLGFEMSSARKAKSQGSITATATGKSWTTVTVKSAVGEKPVLPVYPVVSTPNGPKILLEVDLFAAADRGREFLNQAAIAHLRDFTTPEVVEDLQSLLKAPPAAPAP